MTDDLMSDEEDIINGDNRGKWLIKSPSFRADRLSAFIKILDTRIEKEDPLYSVKRVRSEELSCRVKPLKRRKTAHYKS